MNILYEVGTGLYVNITNRCCCNCIFCIRDEGDSVHGSGSLWLDREPSVEEVIEEFKKRNLSKYSEVVFCGYGEPLLRINEVVEISKFIKTISNIKIRVNTNGLSDLVHGKPTVSMLKGAVDALSISLNASSSEEYNRVSRPKIVGDAHKALLKYAKEAKEVIGDVQFSVVDGDISVEEIERCKELASSMGIPLRVRNKI